VEYGFLPRSRGQWVWQVGVLLLLAWTARSYFTATAEARLLEDQLEIALDSIVDAREARQVAIAVTDSVIEAGEVQAAEDSVAIAEAIEATEDQQREAESAFRRAEALAADNPVLEQAIQEMRAEAIVTEMAFEAERAESAAALFNAQQQIRTLTNSLAAERTATESEITRLNVALELAIAEGDAWERAANPGALTQIWQQGRAALVAVAIVLAVSN